MSPPDAVKNLRQYLKRLGFLGVSIVKCTEPEFAGKYVVTFYDPVEERVPICKVYSLEDMAVITRAGDIFWRFIK